MATTKEGANLSEKNPQFASKAALPQPDMTPASAVERNVLQTPLGQENRVSPLRPGEAIPGEPGELVAEGRRLRYPSSSVVGITASEATPGYASVATPHKGPRRQQKAS